MANATREPRMIATAADCEPATPPPVAPSGECEFRTTMMERQWGPCIRAKGHQGSHLDERGGSYTEAPAAAVCAACNDTHNVETEHGSQMCTRCPVPCSKCRSDIGGVGAFCATTPCKCLCHTAHPKAPSAEPVRLCVDCGKEPADECFTVCTPCWDKAHPTAPGVAAINRARAGLDAMIDDMRAGKPPVVSPELRAMAKRIAEQPRPQLTAEQIDAWAAEAAPQLAADAIAHDRAMTAPEPAPPAPELGERDPDIGCVSDAFRRGHAAGVEQATKAAGDWSQRAAKDRADLARMQEAIDGLREELRRERSDKDCPVCDGGTVMLEGGDSGDSEQCEDCEGTGRSGYSRLAAEVVDLRVDLAEARGERDRLAALADANSRAWKADLDAARAALDNVISAYDDDATSHRISPAHEAERAKALRAAVDAAREVGRPAPAAEGAAVWRELPQAYNGRAQYTLRDDDEPTGAGVVLWRVNGWHALFAPRNATHIFLAHAMADAESMRPEWRGAVRPAEAARAGGE